MISENNQIHTLNIDSTSLVTMPSIDFSKLRDCKVVVRNAVFDEFIDTYGELLTQEGSCIASDAHETQTFTVKNGMVISNDGELYKVTGKSGSSIRLSDKVKSVDADAFKKAENITMLMMPEKNTVQFKDGAFNGSNIQTILCYTRTQAEIVSTQKKAQKKLKQQID